MRIMGMDVGEKRVGIAVSDLMGWTAQGVETVARTKDDQWLLRVSELIREYEVESIIVGLPRNMDGTIGDKGKSCQEIAEMLKERFSLPVELWDERLSTMAVERTLIEADMSRKKRRKVVDKMAASWILQGYLDSKRRNIHE
ncbi:Holliday junction resolvase RuvX [Marininema halotolerans]|uniref:Putative pre-16S rRNA nuclease n=1 Tax=Marininema halotolerans TaxID=1155944 RepID=A0A1I6U7P4_9BACL|nr:Holliday junction resolvase RuvX [Marininema halotolerans]SFS97476.1 putative holliday junction resolvase [Marininema halotolerans]